MKIEKIERVNLEAWRGLLDKFAKGALLKALAADTGFPEGRVRDMLKNGYNNLGRKNEQVLKLNAAMAALEE